VSIINPFISDWVLSLGGRGTLPEPEDPVIGGEATTHNRGGKGASRVDRSTRITGSEQVAGKDCKTVRESRHEGGTVLLMNNHMIDKAEDGRQEEL
jgi:hypothetical protein